jgi:hypothetical protein
MFDFLDALGIISTVPLCAGAAFYEF